MMRRGLFLGGLVGLALACGSTGGDDSAGAGGAGGSVASGGGVATGGMAPATGLLVINEVMYDPTAVADGQGEWVELLNDSEEPLDLAGYVLSDGAGGDHVIEEGVVAPRGYFVLGRTTDAASNGGAKVDEAYGDGFALAQAGDTVILLSPSGEVVDQVNYEPDGAWPTHEPGVSIELREPGLDNQDGTSWAHATAAFGDGDRGTPGGPNGGVDGVAIAPVTSWHQPDLAASAYFAPYDDLATIVEQHMDAAQTSIHIAMFSFRRGALIDKLIAKHQAGVDVKIVFDAFQQNNSSNDTDEQLIAAGVPVTLIDNDSAFYASMHNKFMVIDGHTVLNGSANYTTTGLTTSDEQILVTRNSDLAARYTAELEEILADGNAKSPGYGADDDLRAWMGPEDDLDDIVIDAINGASTSVYVSMFSFSHDPIANALIAAKNKGLRVVVVVDEEQASNATADGDELLIAGGVPVIFANNTNSQWAITHHKYAVIDHETVLFGSYNWTSLASTDNDENLMVVDDAHLAARFEGNFGALLGEYGNGAEAYGLEDGQKPVTFEVTNVTLGEGAELFLVPLQGPLSETKMTGTSITLDVPAGSRLVYRYQVRKGSAVLAQEVGQHAFTVPFAPGGFTLRDALQP